MESLIPIFCIYSFFYKKLNGRGGKCLGQSTCMEDAVNSPTGKIFRVKQQIWAEYQIFTALPWLMYLLKAENIYQLLFFNKVRDQDFSGPKI